MRHVAFKKYSGPHILVDLSSGQVTEIEGKYYPSAFRDGLILMDARTEESFVDRRDLTSGQTDRIGRFATPKVPGFTVREFPPIQASLSRSGKLLLASVDYDREGREEREKACSAYYREAPTAGLFLMDMANGSIRTVVAPGPHQVPAFGWSSSDGYFSYVLAKVETWDWPESPLALGFKAYGEEIFVYDTTTSHANKVDEGVIAYAAWRHAQP